MKTVTDFETVIGEMQSRGLPINERQNCNLAACEARREIFYFQWNPKLAVWAIFEEDEMDRFHAFIQKVIANGQKPRAIRGGQWRTMIDPTKEKGE